MRETQQKLGITTIFVTHDQEQALSISDRVVVMNGAIADQVGTPFQMYNQPRTQFVANFVGTLNTLHAIVTGPAWGHITTMGTPAQMPAALAGAKDLTLGVALRP